MNEDLSKYQRGRRASDDRREKQRESPERREMTGIRLEIHCPTDNVEQWLLQNCQGEYRLILIDVSDDLEHKTIEVMFSSPEDLELFKTNSGYC